MQIRVTMFARVTEGLVAKLAARTRRQKQAVLAVSQREAEATHSLAQSLANRDTGYMASQLRLEFTRGGFNWVIGFRAEDFIGQTNPVTGLLILRFYPVDVIHGTRFYAGNDFLTAAHRLRRLARLQAYRRALQS